MRAAFLTAAALFGTAIILCSPAKAGENADDFMKLHQVEVTFHEAGTTKNLDKMLALLPVTRFSSPAVKSIPARRK